MNCKKTERLLNAYIDNELPFSEVSSLKTHLQACKKCTGKLNELTQLKGLVGTTPTYTANPYLWTRIKASLERVPLPVPTVPVGILVPKALKVWIPVACMLILVSSIILTNINRIEASMQEKTPSIQKAILEIPAVPENMETIALNLLVYNDPKMEVNYALF